MTSAFGSAPRSLRRWNVFGSVPSENVRGRRLFQIPGMPPSLVSLPRGCAFRSRCDRAGPACIEEPAETEPAAGRRVRCFDPLLAEVAA